MNPTEDMNYISREAVLKALRARGRELLKLGTSFESNIASVTALECVNIVKDAPAVDAAPVVHGRWMHHAGYAMCSACGDECWADSVVTYNYCPNCGAKMDKEEER